MNNLNLNKIEKKIFEFYFIIFLLNKIFNINFQFLIKIFFFNLNFKIVNNKFEINNLKL